MKLHQIPLPLCHTVFSYYPTKPLTLHIFSHTALMSFHTLFTGKPTHSANVYWENRQNTWSQKDECPSSAVHCGFTSVLWEMLACSQATLHHVARGTKEHFLAEASRTVNYSSNRFNMGM